MISMVSSYVPRDLIYKGIMTDAYSAFNTAMRPVSSKRPDLQRDYDGTWPEFYYDSDLQRSKRPDLQRDYD